MRIVYWLRYAWIVGPLIGLMACLAGRGATPENSEQAESELLAPDDQGHNGLPAVLLAPAEFARSRPLRDFLRKERLDLRVAPPAVTEALKGPGTRMLMSYIVSCALGPGKTVSQFEDGGGMTWKGALGLCDEWSTNRAAACRTLVSSCVLARTNALGKRVIISMRGDEDFPRAMRDRVLVEDQYRETDNTATDPLNNGIKIPSFRDCAASPDAGDSTRDCGWERLYVGLCRAGATVTARSDPAQCASGRPILLRACQGLYGCQNNEGVNADPASEPPPYHKWLANSTPICGGVGAEVTFPCPANGPGSWGYFSLMAAVKAPAKNRIDPASVSLAFTQIGSPPTAPFHYPATEKEIFTIREGAFFGDIFSADPFLPPGQPTLPREMFACYGSSWSDGLAHLSDRLCAVPFLPCFSTPPGPCFTRPDGNCQFEDAGAGSSYDVCKGNASIWQQPITVYLNHRCDLSAQGVACALKGPGDPKP